MPQTNWRIILLAVLASMTTSFNVFVDAAPRAVSSLPGLPGAVTGTFTGYVPTGVNGQLAWCLALIPVFVNLTVVLFAVLLAPAQHQRDRGDRPARGVAERR
jgi:hypothetical protein